MKQYHYTIMRIPHGTTEEALMAVVNHAADQGHRLHSLVPVEAAERDWHGKAKTYDLLMTLEKEKEAEG